MSKVLMNAKGTYVAITSWENDGDDYQTETMRVDSIGELPYILAVTYRFTKCYHDKDGFYGNTSYEDVDVNEVKDTVNYC